MSIPDPQSPSQERRRTPRIVPLDHPIRCTFDGKHTYAEAALRDLALNSLRFEVEGNLHRGLQRQAVLDFEGHVGTLGLYLRCRARVARTYSAASDGGTISGAAVRFQDLDPAARGQIRGLYPPDTAWPPPTA